MKARLRVAARVTFGVAGLLGLIATFMSTWDRAQDNVVPPWPAIVISAMLVVSGLLVAVNGWLVLLVRSDLRSRLKRAFFVAQLGKYIPGGIWQAVGQVGLSAQAGASTAQATTALPVHSVTQIAGTATIGMITAFTPGVPVQARFGALVGITFLTLLHRRWMVRLLQALRRVSRRIPPSDIVPPQPAILRAYAWALGSMVLTAGGFSVLIGALVPDVSVVQSLPAFSLAWTAGFLALPFPAGIAVREAVLVAVLPTASTAPVIAAAVAHRLVTITAEVALIAWSSARAQHGQGNN